MDPVDPDLDSDPDSDRDPQHWFYGNGNVVIIEVLLYCTVHV